MAPPPAAGRRLSSPRGRCGDERERGTQPFQSVFEPLQSFARLRERGRLVHRERRAYGPMQQRSPGAAKGLFERTEVVERITGELLKRRDLVVLRGHATAAFENNALWHERDISHSSVERVILPDSFIALDHMLRRFTRIVSGMVVYPERMKENLARSRGVVFSGNVLLELARRGISREQSYEWVQRNAMRSFAEGRDFKGLLLGDGEVTAVLPSEAIEEAFDLHAHFRNVDAIFDRVFAGVPAAPREAGELAGAGAPPARG